jgi:hypothetical protein
VKDSNAKYYEWIDSGYDEIGDVTSRTEKPWKNGSSATSEPDPFPWTPNRGAFSPGRESTCHESRVPS